MQTCRAVAQNSGKAAVSVLFSYRTISVNTPLRYPAPNGHGCVLGPRRQRSPHNCWNIAKTNQKHSKYKTTSLRTTFTAFHFFTYEPRSPRQPPDSAVPDWCPVAGAQTPRDRLQCWSETLSPKRSSSSTLRYFHVRMRRYQTPLPVEEGPRDKGFLFFWSWYKPGKGRGRTSLYASVSVVVRQSC